MDAVPILAAVRLVGGAQEKVKVARTAFVHGEG